MYACFNQNLQTTDPDLSRRLRRQNPDIILLPYRIAQQQNFLEGPPGLGSTIFLDRDFIAGLAGEWVVKDTNGEKVQDTVWDTIRFMNIYESAPVVNGRTFNDHLIDFLVDTLLPSGLWDGFFFDNLNARINCFIPYCRDPALLDFDVNGNGRRDETPARITELTRAAALQVMQRIRSELGDLALILANAGPSPETVLAPYVNGSLFECVSHNWFLDYLPLPSEAGWRLSLDDYFTMERDTMAPRVNIIQGCGGPGAFGSGETDRNYLDLTAKDIEVGRFTLATALLGDGFYNYALFDSRSAPSWFDEFSVDENGVAVENRGAKGYLGQPLGEAVHLATPSVSVWEEDFEAGELPPQLAADPAVSVSREASDLIEGAGSLIIDNPDHTKTAVTKAETRPDQLVLTPGKTYAVEYDWEVLETLDASFITYLWGPAPNG